MEILHDLEATMPERLRTLICNEQAIKRRDKVHAHLCITKDHQQDRDHGASHQMERLPCQDVRRDKESKQI